MWWLHREVVTIKAVVEGGKGKVVGRSETSFLACLGKYRAFRL